MLNDVAGAVGPTVHLGAADLADQDAPALAGSLSRADVLAEVADLVPVSDGAHAVQVAVDGVDGSGKTTFADDLAQVLRQLGRPVVRVSLDDFHHPREVRYRQGRTSPQGFFEDSYDLSALHRHVLDPLGRGGSRRFRPGVHDLRTDRSLLAPEQFAAPGSVLVLDGLFLHRSELAGAWDLSFFLDVPFEETFARMARRDGSHPDPGHPSNRRYLEGQRRYLDGCQPQARATVVVDNRDVDRPRWSAGPTSSADSAPPAASSDVQPGIGRRPGPPS